MEAFTVETEYRLEDWAALNAASRVRIMTMGGRRESMMRRLPAIGFAVIMILGVTLLPRVNEKLAWAAGTVLTLIYILFAGILTLRSYRPVAGGLFLGPARLEIGADGLRNKRARSEGFVRWPQVLDVEVNATHIFLWADAVTGYVIPLRDLPAPLTPAGAVERIRAFISAAPAEPPVVVGAFVSTPAAATAALPAAPPDAPARIPIAREIIAVLRLLALLPVDGARLVGSDAAIAVLGACGLAMWLVREPLTVGGDLAFLWFQLPALAWYALGFLALAWLISRLSRPWLAYRRALLLAVGAVPIAIAGSLAFEWLPGQWIFILFALFAAWAMLYFKIGLKAATGFHQFQAVIAAAAAVFVFVILSRHLVYADPVMWGGN